MSLEKLTIEELLKKRAKESDRPVYKPTGVYYGERDIYEMCLYAPRKEPRPEGL